MAVPEKNDLLRVCNLLITMTFIFGIGYSFYLGGHFQFYDEKEYYALGSHLAQKGIISIDGSTPSAWRPPGYALFLAPWIYFGANLVFLRILNFAALSLSLYFIVLILRRFSDVASLIGILMMGLYPVFFFTAGTLYPQTIATTLLLFSIWLLFKNEELSWSAALGIGLSHGFLMLTIPTFSVSLLFFSVWTLMRKWLLQVCLIALGAACILVPWTVRNYLVFGHFVPVSTNGGINLLLGNSPHTTPYSGVNVNLSEYRAPDSFLNEIEADRYYQRKAVEYIKEHPTESLRLYLKKWVHYFDYDNDLATKEEEVPWHSYVLFFSFNLILGVTIVRLLSSFWIPLERFDWFCVLLYLFASMFMSIFFNRIRFRMPFDPLLILLNARFISTFFSSSDRKT